MRSKDQAPTEHPTPPAPTKKILDVVVGVDLGTSWTKVIVQAPHYSGSPAYAVPFGRLADEKNNENLPYPYLLPTRLFVGKDGECSLAPIRAASRLTEIKVALMQNPLSRMESASGPPCDAPATTVATAYLALVLRYVRDWFVKTKKDAFGEYDLRWAWNLGLPAAVDDDLTLRKHFRTTGKAARLASGKPGPITLRAVREAVDDVKNPRFEDGRDIPEFALIPEVIAEVLWYAKSPSRAEDLHLLVDIGASTLDVCSFNLHKNKEGDQFSILTADVKWLGANGLRRATGKGAEEEREFKDKCEKCLRNTIGDLRRWRYPGSPAWSSFLPIFVCGGGSAMRTYQEVVSDTGKWLSEEYIKGSRGVQKLPLPMPESLEAEGVDEESFHRLAVAWGLSHEIVNIGGYRLPAGIRDIDPRPVRNFEDNFIGPEQM